MKETLHTFGAQLTRLFGSKQFFYVIIGFFIFEALWFVFSAAYPMAFDEDFHFGVIKIYAEQWSPFLATHPEGADQFGAVMRDPSYFFHYLMSFPYRFMTLFTSNEATQIIFLRLINVALFAWSLMLFRTVLLRAKASRALTNVALAIFVLIPIVPQLAAHINYDNLFMLLMAWICLLVFRLVDSFREQRIDMPALLTFVTVCLVTSVVKYAALPILFAAFLFVMVMAIREFRGKGKRFRMRVKHEYLRLGKRTKIVLLAGLFIGLGLFMQRYAVNTVLYHHPVPDCGKVLSVEQCQQYGPWGRDHAYEQSRPAEFKASPITFMGSWLEGMRHRLFFAVSGAKTFFMNYIELPVPVKAFTVLTIAGVLAIIVWWRPLFRGHDFLAFFTLITIIYCATLWYDQFTMYQKTGVAVAINGRYLLPVLLPMTAVVGRAFALALKQFRAIQLKPYLAAAAVLLFLHGGGVFTFMLRSDDSWYWPNNAVIDANHAAKNILKPITIEGDKNADWRDQSVF